MTKFRPFILTFFATIIIVTVGIIGINYLVDPLRYYDDREGIDYLKNARFQNAGLARSKHYQTVVMGTSMAQNFNLDQIDEVLNTQSISLTVPAGTAREQFLTLQLALRSQTVERVIWGVHPKAFTLPSDQLRRGGNFPTYLYDTNIANDIFYLFNFSNSSKALKDLLILSGKRKPKHGDWRILNYWAKDYRYGCPHLMNTQLSRSGLPSMSQDHAIPSSIIHETVEQNILSIIDAHPEVEFHLFTPPFSLIAQSLYHQRQPQLFAGHIELRKALFNAIPKRHNATLHDFATDLSITQNLDNYKDITHYHPDINKHIIRAIYNGSHRVVTNNSQQTPELLAEQAVAYSLDEVMADCQSHEVPSTSEHERH